ncbi:nucleoside hydrolase [Pedobacter sp. BS3]|uniref:nucleoside hydrolase n=1 Tax=Pedobacter sp. BS3 TaxID=2567937 RepID=UPI0011EED21C|nr:nucleoside hydrolase [Pedobacter sp. BS3]TZF82523.1 nucleoside hydrolase [Pedobacter sp. BS3]
MKTIKPILLGMFLCLAGLNLYAQFQPAKGEKLNVIFDSDMGPDYDDVGAIAMLHAYADSGYVNILATIACTRYEEVASIFSVFNTYFKRPDIPVGVPKGDAFYGKDRQHWSDTLVAKYPHRIKSNNEVPDAVQLYRKILAAQPDHSVTLITVGFFTNLDNLLKTGADSYSPLSGKELVKKKVRLLVSMAGKFPEGKEFNIIKRPAEGYRVFAAWDIPVLFTGWEIGAKIKTGLTLVNNPAIQNSPVKDAYRIAMPMSPVDHEGRMGWDQTAVLIAIKGYKPFYDLVRGNIKVNPDGSDSWINNKRGNQAYLVDKMPPEKVATYIENVIMHQPR